MTRIKLACFDVLHTLITPRQPIHVQYAEVFKAYRLGSLRPDDVKRSFKVALKSVQKDFPAYVQGHVPWWTEVIRRTALGAGADPKVVESDIETITHRLLTRFSSREGYKAFEDAIPTLQKLHEAGVKTAIVSNGDSRFRQVLEDLEFPMADLQPFLLSEECKIEKPDPRIYDLAREAFNLAPEECLHVGDELEADYYGASNAGWKALLLRRPGTLGEHEHKEVNEDLSDVEVVSCLGDTLAQLNTA
ncbi:hypothetical protein CC1G_12770 [Coprinopsis cinerea okayama7|uniref:Haloacid dehalogenase-like hydrolase domain-containing protein 3 n=1 Tax=Coprinopsis cinerea (strain Okayama-7 / 130 / ATCC MYA-4618 / FGSC 9003) TaxID=240176 RepID=A8N5U6_COPC7|nr:hypothetical protein CC1G_12770 [Coprinopsis cinerea okayama7\|eukprot:XP_001830241.1 hypothetical protein CC1G_12770 [Coprinopsis cinerea okayama7\